MVGETPPPPPYADARSDNWRFRTRLCRSAYAPCLVSTIDWRWCSTVWPALLLLVGALRTGGAWCALMTSTGGGRPVGVRLCFAGDARRGYASAFAGQCDGGLVWFSGWNPTRSSPTCAWRPCR